MSEHELDEAVNCLATGSAICFVGAGFASDATDTQGRNIPSKEKLARELCELIGVTPSEGGSLSDLADYCQNDSELKSRLNMLLINRLTHCSPSDHQKKILEAPWRSIFTTNFDDIAERVLPGSHIQIITPTTDSQLIVQNKVPIYYLHGRALDLLENKGDPSIVISETNFLELRQRNINLHAAFINELHCANKVFFIGYSLRDTEIAQRLFLISEALQSKSIVICSPDEGPVSLARLQKFGAVHAIGLNGLADKISNAPLSNISANLVDRLSFVRRIRAEPASTSITREDVDRLIISGEFDYSKFAAQNSSNDDQSLYCIKRDERIAELFDGISNNINRFVVSSDIGNGKTTFLAQIGYAAHGRGYEVFRVDSRLTEVFSELEKLLSQKSRQLFIIDDLIRNKEVAKFIGSRLAGYSVLVCSTRGDVLDEDHYGDISILLGGTPWPSSAKQTT